MKRFILLLPFLLGAQFGPGSLHKGLVLDAPLTSGYLQASDVPSDRTPYGYHLTSKTGTPVLGSDGVTLDGSESFSLAVSDWSGALSSGSISAWVYLDSLPGLIAAVFTSADTATDDYVVMFYISSTGNACFNVKKAAGVFSTVCTDSTLSTATFYHIGVTTNGSRWLLYINGALAAHSVVNGSDNGDFFADAANRDNIAVGALIRAAGEQYNLSGKIQGVRVNDWEWTATEFAQAYEQGRRVIAASTGSLYKGLVLDAPLISGYLQSATVASDRTPYSNHGTATGTPPTFGADGVTLNGTSDYIDFGDADVFSPTDGAGNDKPFSGSVWANMTDATSCWMIVKDDTAGIREWAFGANSSDVLALFLFTNTASNRILCYSDTAITAYEGSWTHFGFAYDGSESPSGITIYINGQDISCLTDSTGSYTGVVNGTEPLVLGTIPGSGGWCSGSFFGPKLYNRVVSAAEFAQAYTQGSRVIAASTDSLHKGLVLDMPFTSAYTDGTYPNDRVPDGVPTMTLQGTAALDATGMSLDGNSDYAKYTVSDWRSGDSAGTINAWIYLDTLTGDSAVFGSADHASTAHILYMSIESSTSLPFARVRVSTLQNSIDVASCAAGTVTTGAWHMVTFSSDDSNYYIDLDGQPCTLSEVISGVDGDWLGQIANRDSITFGAVEFTSVVQYLDGYVKHGRVYDRALTAAEKLKLYEQGR